jgi:two-component SAPR family response regulator
MFHIVDDDTMMREVLADLIREFGHDALLFSCPAEYLNYMHKPEYVDPVAIISDVNMPRINGYDFIQQVRQIKPKQKFVIVTGSPELEHGYKHLACMYLCKPFIPDSLNNIVAAVVQCHKECNSPEIGCIHLDDRALFGLDGWTCPLSWQSLMAVTKHWMDK